MAKFEHQIYRLFSNEHDELCDQLVEHFFIKNGSEFGKTAFRKFTTYVTSKYPGGQMVADNTLARTHYCLPNGDCLELR